MGLLLLRQSNLPERHVGIGNIQVAKKHLHIMRGKGRDAQHARDHIHHMHCRPQDADHGIEKDTPFEQQRRR